LLEAITAQGFTAPTPIQAQSIPHILEGRDLIGQAQTGTGKTAAFALPTLEKVTPGFASPQVLVLAPTRELAVQISEVYRTFGDYMNEVYSVAIYGGDSMDRQVRVLRKGCQIVIGTPGRIMDHIRRRTLDLSHITTVVLDEADEMLDMGFREDIEYVLEQLPEARQTLFFSATLSKEILTLTKKYQSDPVMIKTVTNELTVATIEQNYFQISPNMKTELMTRLIDFHDLKTSIVFCNTKMRVDELAVELQKSGLLVEGLHGDLSQQQRSAAMKRFREGTLNVLVATDVAARGIDVNNVDAVFNFDLPLDPEYYVHRIGRTGRAGKKGYSYTFVTKKEIYKLRQIEKFTKALITPGTLPKLSDIMKVRLARFAQTIPDAFKSPEESMLYSEMVNALESDGHDLKTIAAILLRQAIGYKETTEANLNSGGDDYEGGRGERGGRREYDRDSRDGRGSRDRDRDGGGRGFERGGRERGGNESFGGKSRERSGGYDRPSFDRGDRDKGVDRGFDRGFSRGGDDFGGRKREEPNMTRLFVSLGKRDDVSKSEILDLIVTKSGLEKKNIGNIDILDKFSFINISTGAVPKFMKTMTTNTNTVNGIEVRFEIAGK